MNHEQLVPIGLVVLGLALTVIGVLLLIGRLGGRPHPTFSRHK
jgi:hypothetical protein